MLSQPCSRVPGFLPPTSTTILVRKSDLHANSIFWEDGCSISKYWEHLILHPFPARKESAGILKEKTALLS